MADPVRNQIVAAIAATNDNSMKVILMLMLGVLEEIGSKIDAMRADEKGLREAVLNGHEAVHNAHHEWVSIRMSSDCAIGCDWAAKKKREEEDAVKDDKASKRRIRDGLIEKALWVILVAAAGSGWLIK